MPAAAAAARHGERCSTPCAGCGDATVDDVAEALGITVSGARQHLRPLADDGLVVVAESPATGGRRGRPQRSLPRSPSWPRRCSPRPTASSPTSCSATWPTRTRRTVDRLFARRRDSRIAHAPQPAGAKPRWPREGRRAGRDPRRGRLPRRPGERRPRPLPDRRAQLRHPRRGPPHAQACTSEIEFIRAVLPDADVERTSAHRSPAPATAPTRSVRRDQTPCSRGPRRPRGPPDDGDRAEISRWWVAPSCRRAAERGGQTRRRGRARGDGSRRAPCWHAPDGRPRSASPRR